MSFVSWLSKISFFQTYLSRTEAQPEKYFEYELQTQPIYHSYSLSPPKIPIEISSYL